MKRRKFLALCTAAVSTFKRLAAKPKFPTSQDKATATNFIVQSQAADRMILDDDDPWLQPHATKDTDTLLRARGLEPHQREYWLAVVAMRDKHVRIGEK